MNIEPAICNGHLPYQWRRHWREVRAGRWTQGVGVGKAKRPGRGGSA